MRWQQELKYSTYEYGARVVSIFKDRRSRICPLKKRQTLGIADVVIIAGAMMGLYECDE